VDGIISTRAQLIRLAKEQNLITVQRFFALDSKGMESIEEMLRATNPHLMEIMPGVIGKAIRRFRKSGIAVIAGGLIETKQEVTDALGAGATAVSTGQQTLWYL
jgi:glycerol uptake operon antiterminator